MPGSRAWWEASSEHPDALLAVGGELRPIARDRRLHVELAAVDQHEQAQGDEAFGAGEDHLQGVALPWPSRLRVGDPAPQVDDRLAVAAHRERRAKLAAVAQVLDEHVAHGLEAVGHVAVDQHLVRTGDRHVSLQPFTEPWSSAVTNWRWKIRKTTSVGRQDQQRAGAQQRDVGAPLALEGAEGAGHGALGGVVDEHDGEQELVPGPQEQQDRQRRDRRHGQRHVDAPEQLPGVGAVDPRRPRRARRAR